MSSESAGDVVSSFIEKQLTTERATKASLETRGLAVITSAGTLTTLLLALSALVAQRPAYALPGGAWVPISVAATAFLLSAVVAVYSNAPMKSMTVAPAAFKEHLTDKYWGAPKSEAVRAVANSQLILLGAVQNQNKKKALILMAAIIGETIGVIAIGVTVIMLVTV
ncbi:hypothetical protein [Micromonospora sp. WMMD975]|uniref:hypothetical protein n=1 Tax=Micromonospora sp. WMMD975 TaxID=3016087 RepID=UPI00249A2654|nr:hypothetical protein [Micromonospora sp. WMMD975]WFE35297.1 hypothetical protein O7613_07925 [Micromonospora sp. WMMD975]